MKSVNSKNRRKGHARSYGEEGEAIRRLGCLTGAPGPVVLAHVVARGMGNARGGRFDIVPLTQAMHTAAGEANTGQRTKFERQHSLNLRQEADALALCHARPLGIRGLADRWALGWPSGHDMEGAQRARVLDAMELYCGLDRYEAEALLGWVRRRLILAVKWHHVDGAVDGDAVDREDLAQEVLDALGGELACDPGGPHGMTWELCALAGWPS